MSQILSFLIALNFNLFAFQNKNNEINVFKNLSTNQSYAVTSKLLYKQIRRSNPLTYFDQRSGTRKYPKTKNLARILVEPREKTKIKETSSNVSDERYQILRSLRAFRQHSIQTRLTKYASAVEDLRKQFV